MTTMSENL